MKSRSRINTTFKVMAGAAALLAAVLIGVLSLRPATLSGVRSESAAGAVNGAGPWGHSLDPNRFQGDVKKAYEIARRDPRLLAQMKCYCRCDRSLGHTSLLDCYRDMHAAGCGICIGEALDADFAANRGLPVEQIQQALRERYSHFE